MGHEHRCASCEKARLKGYTQVNASRQVGGRITMTFSVRERSVAKVALSHHTGDTVILHLVVTGGVTTRW